MRLYEVFRRQPVDQSSPYDSGKGPTPLASWRGPHRNRHLTLMLAGKKPIAWIEDLSDFQPYINNGTFILHDFDWGEKYPGYDSWLVTLPGQEWRAKKLQTIYLQDDQYKVAGKENLWHARIGMLLGYTNDDIRKFINQD